MFQDQESDPIFKGIFNGILYLHLQMVVDGGRPSSRDHLENLSNSEVKFFEIDKVCHFGSSDLITLHLSTLVYPYT